MSASVGSLSKLLWFVSQFKTPSVASSFGWIHQTGNSSSQNLLAQKAELPATVWCRCLSAHTDTQILFFLDAETGEIMRLTHVPLEGSYNRGTDQLHWEKAWMGQNIESEPDASETETHLFYCLFSSFHSVHLDIFYTLPGSWLSFVFPLQRCILKATMSPSWHPWPN